MKKILFIVGSLRKESFNAQLAEFAENSFENAEISYLDFSKVPVFNQDLENPVLPEVAEIRNAVLRSDAIWLFSPVYNHSIPGPVKNLFDWLSRGIDGGDSAVKNKKIAVSLLAASGFETASQHYSRFLSQIMMKLSGEIAEFQIPAETWSDGKLRISAVFEEKINSQIAKLSK